MRRDTPASDLFSATAGGGGGVDIMCCNTSRQCPDAKPFCDWTLPASGQCPPGVDPTLQTGRCVETSADFPLSGTVLPDPHEALLFWVGVGALVGLAVYRTYRRAAGRA